MSRELGGVYGATLSAEYISQSGREYNKALWYRWRKKYLEEGK